MSVRALTAPAKRRTVDSIVVCRVKPAFSTGARKVHSRLDLGEACRQTVKLADPKASQQEKPSTDSPRTRLWCIYRQPTKNKDTPTEEKKKNNMRLIQPRPLIARWIQG